MLLHQLLLGRKLSDALEISVTLVFKCLEDCIADRSREIDLTRSLAAIESLRPRFGARCLDDPDRPDAPQVLDIS